MNESELEEAYQILRVKPGCTLEQVMNQHRLLAMIWHPDRVTNEQDKRFAEEELKKINHAKDVLEAYFNGLAQATESKEQKHDHGSEIARRQQNTTAQSGQIQKVNDEPIIGLRKISSQIGRRGWVLILVILAMLIMMGRSSNNLSNNTPPKQPQEEEITRYYEVMDGGRKKIISRVEKVSGKAALEQGIIRCADVEADSKRRSDANYAGSLKSTAHPAANLPAIPGINAPLPKQGVPRSGLPLMPLGDRH